MQVQSSSSLESENWDSIGEKMAEIDGGHLFAKALKKEGVEYIFTSVSYTHLTLPTILLV